MRGRDLLYARCSTAGIPFKQLGKLIIATTPGQAAYIEGLKIQAERLQASGMGDMPLHPLTGEQARELEPDLSPAVISAVLSPLTGIVSSHELMLDLEKAIEESDSGELVYGTKVVRIDRAETKSGSKRGDGSEDGWVVQTVTRDGAGVFGEPTAVLAKVVVNCAGLKYVKLFHLDPLVDLGADLSMWLFSAHHMVNQIRGQEARTPLYYAAGNYFTYRGPGTQHVTRLLYPSPDSSSFAGLGTHLTLNLEGEVRFGPDLEWLEAPLQATSDEGEAEDEMDFWERHLSAKDTQMGAAIEAVQRYLPNVQASGFSPDCELFLPLERLAMSLIFVFNDSRRRNPSQAYAQGGTPA